MIRLLKLRRISSDAVQCSQRSMRMLLKGRQSNLGEDYLSLKNDMSIDSCAGICVRSVDAPNFLGAIPYFRNL